MPDLRSARAISCALSTLLAILVATTSLHACVPAAFAAGDDGVVHVTSTPLDTFVSSAYPGTNFSAHQLSWVNANAPNATWTEYALVQPSETMLADFESRAEQGYAVVGGRVGFWVYGVSSPGAVVAQACTDEVDIPSVTWENRPATTADDQSSPVIVGGTGSLLVLDVSEALKRWAEAGDAGPALRISGTAGTHVGFESAERPNKPLFSIDYAGRPQVTIVSPSDGAETTGPPSVVWAYREQLTGNVQSDWSLELLDAETAEVLAVIGGVGASNQAPLPSPPGGLQAGREYVLSLRVASRPVAGGPPLWSDPETASFVLALPADLGDVTAETTASAHVFEERDTDGDGFNDVPDDGPAGRGSVTLAWEASEGAAGYGIYLSDGSHFWQVGSTETTSWSTAGRGIYPPDSAIAARSADSTACPFLRDGSGLDLRDDPRPLYRRTTGPMTSRSPAYTFKVSPYNGNGEVALSECPSIPVALDDRSARLGRGELHTDYALSDLWADEASVRLDRPALRLRVNDLSLPSLGPDAQVSRYYSSSGDAVTRLSPGWRFSFEAHVSADSTAADVLDLDGSLHRFVKDGRVWVAPDGCTDRLHDVDGGFELRRADRSVAGFDGSGRLAWETDKNSNRVSYDWSDRSLTIRTPADSWPLAPHRIEVAFDDRGLVTEATARTVDGVRTVRYAPTSSQLCVTKAPGTSAESRTIYRYSGGRISEIAAPGFSPSATGEALWRVEYGSEEQSLTVRNASGAGTPGVPKRFVWGEPGRATVFSATGSSEIAWNERGAEVSRTSENTTAATGYVYDAAGNRIRETSPGGAVSRTVFDGDGNPLWESDPTGALTRYEYRDGLCVREVDPRGCETSRTYDSEGNLLCESRALDEGDSVAVTAYTYYATPWPGALKSERTRIDGPLYAVTEYDQYAECGEPEQTIVRSVELAAGTIRDLVTRKEYDAFGGVTSETNPLGVVERRVGYDESGRPVTTTDQSGTVTRTTYGLGGSVVETKRTNPATSTVCDWRTSQLNGLGSPTLEVERASDGTTVSVTVLRYDESGRITGRDKSAIPGASVVRYSPTGAATAIWDEGSDTSKDSASTRMAFDAEGRPSREAEPGSVSAETCTTYDAAGRVVAQSLPDSTSVSVAYDAGGAVRQESQPTEAGTATVEYEIDLAGRTTAAVNPSGVETTVTYNLTDEVTSVSLGDQAASRSIRNALGWELRHVDPDGVDLVTGYDATGRVVSETVGRQLATTFAYDAAGREVSRKNSDGSQRLRTWDVFGRLVGDRHVSATGADLIRASIAYDSAGRVSRQYESVSGSSREYAYGAAGDTTITERRRAGAVVMRSSRDGTGALRSVEATLAGRRVGWSVVATDVAGRVVDATSTALSNDWRREYDEAGRRKRDGGGPTPGAGRFVYRYSSASGERTNEAFRSALRGSETSTYTRGVDGRVSSASTNGVAYRYDYDPESGSLRAYRRGSEPTVTIGFDYLGRPSACGSWTYANDSLGRRTSGASLLEPYLVYTWTGDRLTTLSSLMRWRASHTYDAAGQRLKSVVTSGGVSTTTQWAYDGMQLQGLAASTSLSTTWTIDYLYTDSGSPVAGVYRASDSTAVAFSVVANDRGDIRELLDVSGRAFVYYRYDPYGRPLETAAVGTTAVPLVTATRIAQRQVLRYAGYVWDAESGLYYLSQRYYDPAMGAFISKDPASADGEESAYQYCGGDPVSATDPSGLIFWSIHERDTYDRVRAGIVAAAQQLVDWKVSYGNGQQVAKAKGTMDCSGAAAWVFRQSDHWFAARIPNPAGPGRWISTDFANRISWRVKHSGRRRFSARREWRIGDVLVKGWVNQRMGHVAVVLEDGAHPKVFECAGSRLKGFRSGARIIPLSTRLTTWRPVWNGRLFAYEPNKPYGGVR